MTRAGRRAALAAALAGGLALVTFAAPAGQDPSGEEEQLPATGREGPLRNDALVPFSKEVAEPLAQGDTALGTIDPAVRSGRRPPGEADRRALLKAAEAWSAALKASQPGDPVPLDLAPWLPAGGFRLPDPEGSFPRRSEAIEYGLLRRLDALPPALRSVWEEREAPAAIEALAVAGAREDLLGRVEHLHPGTRAAALAALRCFELAFERGRPAIAASWLERARLHAATAGADDVRAGADARAAAAGLAAPSPESPPAWDAAESLAAAGEPVAVPPPTTGGYRGSPTAPGLALLSGGRIAVRTPEVVWITAPNGHARGFEPPKLADAAGLLPPGPVAGPDAPWLQAPASDGERLFLVEGRAGPWPRGTRPTDASASWHSNMLLCARPPEEMRLPELVWALGPDVWYREEGARVPLADALGPGMWEFQPGPAITEGLLLVQARQWLVEEPAAETPSPADPTAPPDPEPPPPAASPSRGTELASPGEARIWALALDADTGAVVWKRWLAVGTDLVPDLGLAFRRKYQVRTAAQPLVLAGSRAFFPTSLGLGLLLDLADGRLAWSFANRRREPEARGWRVSRAPPVARGERGGAPVAAVLFAPPDSDQLYWLRLAPDLDGAGLLLHAPQPIGEAEELAGGDLERAIVLGRSGARRTLAMWDAESGRRTDSIYLGRDERFVPGALVGERRALFATDAGLYLLDLERELYLLQQIPLELDLSTPAGGLFARDGTVWLLAERKLSSFGVD